MITGPVWNEQDLTRENVFPTILALGDSWFWYPKGNLASPLHRILNSGSQQHVMLVRGANGAEAVSYAKGTIRAQIDRDLDRKKGYGRTLQAVLLSGGGNDLAGPEDFIPLLLPDCTGLSSPAACLQAGQPQALFKEVTDALATVIDLVQAKIPGTPVLVHGYDYANPNGQGFLGMGQWLQFPMDQCKVKRSLQQRLVNLMIDTYWQALLDLQARYPGVLHLVDQRGTLGPDDWANELHPTPAGFKRIGQCWAAPLKTVGIVS